MQLIVEDREIGTPCPVCGWTRLYDPEPEGDERKVFELLAGVGGGASLPERDDSQWVRWEDYVRSPLGSPMRAIDWTLARLEHPNEIERLVRSGEARRLADGRVVLSSSLKSEVESEGGAKC